MGHVTDGFDRIQIDLMSNTYDPTKGAHSFCFFTKIFFNNAVSENEFKHDLVFEQDVRSVSNRECVVANATVLRELYRTEWHDDGYSVQDFKWSGSDTPEISYIMTNDTPGAYGVFFADDTINWVFEFKQRVYDRNGWRGDKTLQHETGPFRIQVRGNGAHAAFLTPASGAGCLY